MYFFCHILVTHPIDKDQPIIEVPPAIFDRIIYYSATFNQVPSSLGTSKVYDVTMYVKTAEDGKHYFYSIGNITLVDYYLVGYYILKDI